MENLLDLAHAPFTHTSTFAKGWPIPDSVKFKAAEYLGGNWEPYPIDMTFQPPCCVQSTIGLAQPGKILRGQRADACKNHLHQLHVCLPSKPGHTRLLYRMSMDFMHWVKWVPFIQNFWQRIAGQVLTPCTLSALPDTHPRKLVLCQALSHHSVSAVYTCAVAVTPVGRNDHAISARHCQLPNFVGGVNWLCQRRHNAVSLSAGAR